MLLYRFAKRFAVLVSKISKHESFPYYGAKLVLTNDKIIPYSFLKYIFVDRETFEKGAIDKKILTHELAHVRQKHSVDILMFEVLLIFAWFNPVLYWYKRAIQLNHEFLADDVVVKAFHSTPAYQRLLLAVASQKDSSFLTTPLTYLITKKRLTMMTKSTKPGMAVCKITALIPLLAGIVLLMGSKAVAQNPAKGTPQQPKLVASTTAGASQAQMDEYKAIVDKYKTSDQKWFREFREKITPKDKNRLEKIFLQMNPEQQSKQNIAFIAQPGPLPKIVPTEKQLESWKNPKVYGLWIDGKHVGNSTLDKYTNTDFSQVFVSKLMKNAINADKYSYQVDLMTNDGYQHYRKKVLSNKGNNILVYRPSTKKK